MLLVKHKREICLYRISTGDKIGIHYHYPKKRKSWEPRGHASTAEYSRKETSIASTTALNTTRLFPCIDHSQVAASVKTYLKTLNREFLYQSMYSLDIAISDNSLFQSMFHGISQEHFKTYEDTKSWVDL
ncbi:hypothetical protein TNCV_3017851 [Trichonephila clavipes]|nr:hypothetical protein TNCV_3017851 [Trichonephila clavipes]